MMPVKNETDYTKMISDYIGVDFDSIEQDYMSGMKQEVTGKFYDHTMGFLFSSPKDVTYDQRMPVLVVVAKTKDGRYCKLEIKPEEYSDEVDDELVSKGFGFSVRLSGLNRNETKLLYCVANKLKDAFNAQGELGGEDDSP